MNEPIEIMPDDLLTSQIEHLIAVLERIAAALEDQSEQSDYVLALEKWKLGQGRHPDD